MNLKQSINPSHVDTVVDVSKDRVEFQTPNGHNVVVSRYLRGWKPALRIVVNSVVWHDADASADEQILFNDVQQVAWERRDTAHAAAKAYASVLAARMFGAEK